MLATPILFQIPAWVAGLVAYLAFVGLILCIVHAAKKQPPSPPEL